jgi:hypothetical protein
MSGWTRDQLEKISKEGNKFRGLKLHGADFTGMNLEKADFRSASCPYAVFKDTNCKFINAEGANFTCTSWGGSNIHRGNFKDAILCDADWRGVKDMFGITMTMECRTWQGLKLDPGFYYGFLFYGMLMEPPSEEIKDKLITFFGVDHFKTLHKLYANRQM